MSGKEIALLVIPFIALTIFIEYLLSKHYLKESVYRIRDSLVGCNLSITSFISGLAFTATHLSAYAYIVKNWSPAFPGGTSWQTWLVAIIVYDFLYYWCHYFHHKVNFLWGNHIVHHSGEDYNFILAIRIGALGTFTVWPFFIPMAFIGIPLEVYAGVAGLQMAYQYLLHTRLIPELGALEKILVTPSQHRVHHAKNPEYIDKNMGCFFVVWDRLFGTYQKELKEVPVVYGVTAPLRKNLPEAINLQHYTGLVKAALHAKSPVELLATLFGPPKSSKKRTHEGNDLNRSITAGEKIAIVLLYSPCILIGYQLILSYGEVPPYKFLVALLSMIITTNLCGISLEGERRKKYLTVLSQIFLLIGGTFLIQDSYNHIPVIIIFLAIANILVQVLATFGDNTPNKATSTWPLP